MPEVVPLACGMRRGGQVKSYQIKIEWQHWQGHRQRLRQPFRPRDVQYQVPMWRLVTVMAQAEAGSPRPISGLWLIQLGEASTVGQFGYFFFSFMIGNEWVQGAQVGGRLRGMVQLDCLWLGVAYRGFMQPSLVAQPDANYGSTVARCWLSFA